MTTASFRHLFTRDHLLLIASAGVLMALSWAYMLHMALMMPMEHAIGSPHGQPWTGQDVLMAVLMWSVMMIGMMLPSVTPWVLTISGGKTGSLTTATAFFSGYLLVWIGYSAMAAGMQCALNRYVLILTDAGPVFGGLLLILAGLYQWTPVKEACLTHCRSPMGFFLAAWKDGRWGAAQMGFRHGLYCVGCCWALMLLMFVAGVMNLLWMAAITLFIFIDHTLAAGPWPGKIAGLLLLGWGGWLIARTI